MKNTNRCRTKVADFPNNIFWRSSSKNARIRRRSSSTGTWQWSLLASHPAVTFNWTTRLLTRTPSQKAGLRTPAPAARSARGPACRWVGLHHHASPAASGTATSSLCFQRSWTRLCKPALCSQLLPSHLCVNYFKFSKTRDNSQVERSFIFLLFLCLKLDTAHFVSSRLFGLLPIHTVFALH